MRKIRITEAQFRKIWESEMGYPLDTKADDGKPDNFTGDEVAVNNIDRDAPNDVTTSGTIKRSKEGWFGMNRYPAFYRIPESRELDDKEVSGFGKNSDAAINSIASNNGGKMLHNLANEINSDKRGVRNNTLQVRISRMEDDKVNNPEHFQKNGGEEVLKRMKSQVNKTSAANNASNSLPQTKNTNPNVSSDTHGDGSSNGVIYFK